MKNKLQDLNDHLFAQLERLSEEGLSAEAIETESRRARAIVDVSDQIVNIADMKIQAARLYANHGDRILPHLPQIGTTGPEQLKNITPDEEGGQ